MAGVRVLNSYRGIREPGNTVGVTVSTFRLARLEAGVTGAHLNVIQLAAMEPTLEQARADWPVDTAASIDTMKLNTVEVGERSCRVALQVGGPELIADPRNTKHIDYAPFIEFNGSPTGKGQGAIRQAMFENKQAIRDAIHSGVSELIRDLLV